MAATHTCDNCEGIDPDTCLANTDRAKQRATNPDDSAMQALSDAGAVCGNCGDQPGDRNCPDCEDCYQEYVTALRAAGWAPRAGELTPGHEEQIRAREKAATPGPWEAVIDPDDDGFPSTAVGVATPDEVFVVGDDQLLRADAEFIAHAREDVRLLLAEVERLRTLVTELEEAAQGPSSEPCACGQPWHCDRKVHTANLMFAPR